MANSRTTPPKTGTLTEFPQPETAVGVAEPPEPAAPGQEAAQAPSSKPKPPNKGGRPPKGAPTPETNFFQKVLAVPAEDWGTRVYLYLYQIEPVCDLKQSGGKAYLMRYQEPVRDEHQIMLEQGSGKYRLVLALNKYTAGASQQTPNALAQYDFEIYNPKYPPKIPREVWVNDQRNRRWEALLPEKPTPAAAGAASTMVEAMQLVSDIRSNVREEMESNQPEQTAGGIVETIKAVKELFPQPAAATSTAKDPLEIAVALATTMMQMKADNPVIDMYRDELKALREEMKEERAAARAREEAKPTTAPKGLLEQLTEIAAMGDKLEPLKKLFGFGNGTEVAGRAARTTGLDVVRDLVTGPAGATLAQGIGVLISNLANATASNPATPKAPPVFINAQQPNGTIPPVENAEQRIQRIGETVTRPMLGEYFMKNATGAEWAQAMFDLWPEDYVFMRTLGAENLVNRYRRFPEAWAVIGYREADFVKFIEEFCVWDPNAEEGPAPPGNGDDGLVDLENKEAGS